MFEPRDLTPAVEAVRDEYAPETLVLDCERDFETLPSQHAEALGLVVDSLRPRAYPEEWLPPNAPVLLTRYAGQDFTIGMPGDGSVVWTRQTEPPVILVKARVRGSPANFVDFLLAEAILELSIDVPEHFLGFFEADYHELDSVIPLDGNATSQLAAALYDGWKGLHTRETFAGWQDTHSDLADAWADAGSRLESRIATLPGAVARGETSIADATELACSAIKHEIDLPTPFGALDTVAYREHGTAYAIRWAEKTFDALAE